MKSLILLIAVYAGITAAAELPNIAPQDDQVCEMCKQLVGQVINKQALEQLLHQVEAYCDYLPGDLGTQCRQLVDQYGEQLINEILTNFNPDKICKDLLHVCQANTLVLAGIPFPAAPAVHKQQDQCEACKALVEQYFLNKNVLEKLLHEVERVCDKLPGSLSQQCVAILDEFGEQLIDTILQKYTPDYVCKNFLHLCSRNAEPESHHPFAYLMDPKGKDQLCAVCMSVATQVLNKDTLNALLEHVEQLCDQLPGWAGQQCHSMVDQEGHRIIDHLLSSVTPDKLCKDYLHFC